MTALATNRTGPLPEAVERVLVGGDLSKLTVEDRLAFYQSRCEAAGLDPRTQPFQYLSLQGKLTLYATKAATDQLIALHKLTVMILSRDYDEGIGCYIVQCRVAFPDGHTVEDIGVLPLPQARGEVMANAMMKCVTKAKRRTVLSACGLGMLDESEVDSIQGAVVSASATIAPQPRLMPPPEPRPTRMIPRPSTPYSEPIARAGSFREWVDNQCKCVKDKWANTCLIEGVEPGKTPGSSQVGNHLVKVWIETGALDEAEITVDGKRDKRRVAEALNAAWEGEDRDEVKDEVVSYLRSEVEKLAEAAGVNLDSEPSEAEVVEAASE